MKRRSADEPRRLAALARPIAAAARARAQSAAPARADRPYVDGGALRPGAAAPLWDDAREVAPIFGAAYAQEPIQTARAAATDDARVHNDACVPLTHWVCDGLAELDAIAVLLECTRLGELDVAVAHTLRAWKTSGGEDVPRVPRLAPAIDAVLGALRDVCRRGVTGDDALAVVAPIVALVELMRLPADAPVPGGGALADAVVRMRRELGAYREELARLGAAIDRASGKPGDRVAVALGIAARANQVALIAHAIARWLDAPATAAQQRWRGVAATIEETFAGSLAGVRRLVPLPP